MALLKAFGNILTILTTASTIVGAVAIIMMILHVTIDVMLRNLFLLSVPGTGGIVANYYMAAASFLPVALAEKLEQHIAVDVLHEKLPSVAKIINLQFVRLVVAVAAGAAAYGFLLDALQKYHLGSYVLEMNVRIANWPGYFMLPFGFGLWSLISAHRFLAVLTGSPDLPISKYIEAKPETA